jgi:hypothetical protein
VDSASTSSASSWAGCSSRSFSTTSGVMTATEESSSSALSPRDSCPTATRLQHFSACRRSRASSSSCTGCPGADPDASHTSRAARSAAQASISSVRKSPRRKRVRRERTTLPLTKRAVSSGPLGVRKHRRGSSCSMATPTTMS